MYILADIEWANSREKRQSITQIAAVKVNELWERESSFSSLVRPQNAAFEDWKQICYTGAAPIDFMQAPSAYEVLLEFETWLDADDVLVFWFEQSWKVFSLMRKIILRPKMNRAGVALAPYLPQFLGNPAAYKLNPYRLCKKYGLTVKPREHVSVNDVDAMISFLSALQMPQSLLLEPPIEYEPNAHLHGSEAALQRIIRFYPYALDVTDGVLHRCDCRELQAEHEFQGLLTVDKYLKGKCTACICVRDDVKLARIKRNADTIKRSGYNYIFIPKSKVFHKPSCLSIRNTAEVLMGTVYYDSAVITGRGPCRLCKPSPHDPKKPVMQNAVNEDHNKDKYVYEPSEKEQKAVKRQKQMVAERIRALKEEGLTNQQVNDIYTLTQPEYAFWAGKGMATFHRRGCPKMVGLTDLQGFKYFNQAVRAGFSPCRQCKPTEKQNIMVSVPVNNQVRERDSVTFVVMMCAKAGYSCEFRDDIVEIGTPVGEWRIDTKASPIRVEHKHLLDDASGFHRQPRVFLSLYDTFAYIRRHDRKLVDRVKEQADGEKNDDD